MRPMLETVADGEPHALKEVVGRMQAQSGLSSEQLAETIPSGQLKFRNRSLWAATYLRKAQALSTTKRGWVQLAERGRQLLSEPGPVTVARLQEFPGWQEAWGTAARDESSPTGTSEPAQETESTPEEQIANGIEQLEAFEQLMLRLLGALGYGDGPQSRHGVRRGPDGGIDGRIDEDRLGLASIYIQAKRYQEQSVGRPMVQSFYGAMGSHGATKGVFLTTSTFSREASDCAAEYKDKKIVLIDGNRLTRLMIDAGVGVSVQKTYLVHRLDEDFFAEFEEE
jgi:restriction system protein